MNISQAEELNLRAEKMLSSNDATAALALFQDVFLQCGKNSDEGARVQVARALCGAARCCDEMENRTMASSIRQTLERRFSGDAHPKVRYWLELANGKVASSAASESNEYSMPQAATETPIPNADEPSMQSREAQPGEAWDEFLSTNLLAAGDDHADVEPTNVDHETTSETALQTPVVSEPFSQAPQNYLSRDEISLARLSQIFNNAFIENTLGSELRVKSEDGFIFVLTLNETHSLIYFRALFNLRKLAPQEEKLAMANSMNEGVVLVRFSVSGDTTLCADHHLLYEQGIAPKHIIHTLRIMENVIAHAFKEHDQNDLIA